MTDWNHASLEELPSLIWNALGSAAADGSHPFRFAAVATGSPAACALRTVVLREVHAERRQLVFFTDVRSPKISELRAAPRLAWLFYDAAERVQVRATATARIHHNDEIAARGWEQTPVTGRLNYSTVDAPGTALDGWADSLPAELRVAAPDERNTMAGRGNFAVVATVVDRLDWLWLNPAGHRRAEWTWDGTRFGGRWITP